VALQLGVWARGKQLLTIKNEPVTKYKHDPQTWTDSLDAYKLLVGKPEGKRPLERPRRRRMDYIKMDLLEIGWGSVDWIGLSQDRDKSRAL
jgi:hypothetical protein